MCTSSVWSIVWMGKSVDCLLRRARNLVKPEAKRITVDPSRRTHGISLPGNPSPPSRLFSNVSRSIRSSLSVYSLSLDLTKKKKKKRKKKNRRERERGKTKKKKQRQRNFQLGAKIRYFWTEYDPLCHPASTNIAKCPLSRWITLIISKPEVHRI